MELTVTASGKMASGKTRTLELMKQALLAAGAPVEPIDVTFYEVQNKGPKEQADQFTVDAARSGRKQGDGHRETWSINLGATGRSPQVMRGSTWQATFKYQAAARTFMQWMTANKEQREAITAILADPNYGAPTTQPVDQPKNCQGGGGDFAEGAGVIPKEALDQLGAEMAPEFRCEDMTQVLAQETEQAFENQAKYHRLARAAKALYRAGSWYLSGPNFLRSGEQAQLWANLRDALDLPPGTATAAGVSFTAPQEDVAWLRGALDRMIGRWQRQNKALTAAHDLLGTVADVFDRYAEDHEAKGALEMHVKPNRAEVAQDKAQRNRRLARMCRAAIPTVTETPPEEIGIASRGDER